MKRRVINWISDEELTVVVFLLTKKPHSAKGSELFTSSGTGHHAHWYLNAVGRLRTVSHEYRASLHILEKGGSSVSPLLFDKHKPDPLI